MTRHFRLLAFSAALLIAGAAPAAPDEIQGADIIDRVDRALRVSPQTANSWHQGVATLDAWPARLERALLETLGPEELRDPESGLSTLDALLEARPTDIRITETAHETLAVIVALIRRQVSLARQRDEAESALNEEREAHRQTLDKLKALREIDSQLDMREDNGGR